MNRSVVLAWTACILVSGGATFAQVDAEKKSRIVALRLELKKAGSLFVGGDFKESGAVIERVQKELHTLAKGANEPTLKELGELHAVLSRAHALLKVRGVTLPELLPLEKASSKPEPAPNSPAPNGAVSFTKQVAPILVGKCGNCHVRNARGMFSMANYETLMKGNNDGKVVFEGDANNSRIIEVIESGDMPRGGLKVSPQELQTLETWIQQGAKFDGADKTANLMSLAPNVDSNLPKVELKQATGKETISFASDIAPILNDKCANCHGNGRRPSARFNLTTMKGLLRGGESGPAVLPGKVEESLLYQKITNPKSGQRMPLRQPALEDEQIAKIRTWIQEGATFDGPDPDQHIAQVAALAKAMAATHEELMADRVLLAEKNWKLGMASEQGYSAETDNFFVMGNHGEATVAEFAKQAEVVAPKVAEMFGAASDKPLFKGRMTLFLFKQRYDYSEFGKMVEKRDLPRSWRGHWRFNIVDAYAAVIPPRAEEYAFEPLVVEQVAAGYVASLGTPKWLAGGAGRVAASRLAKDDPRVVQWESQLSEVLQSMEKPDDFLQGKLPSEAEAIAGYSFVKFLMGRDAGRFKRLLSETQGGTPFEQAFRAIYGRTPAELSPAWYGSVARKSRSRR